MAANKPELKAPAQRDYILGMSVRKVMAKYGVSNVTAQAWRAEIADKVLEALEERNAKVAEDLKITAERVLEEYAKVAFYRPSRVFMADGSGQVFADYSDATEWDFDNVAEVTNETVFIPGAGKDDEGRHIQKTKVKMQPKGPALDALAKHLGLNAPIQVEDVTQLTPEQRESRLAELRDRLRARADQRAADE